MAKGGDFERGIAKILSLWWSKGKREDIFYRSQASGGRFTSRKKAGKDTALQGGDITASDPIGEPLIKEWSIEIKTGYGKKTESGINRWDILDFLDSRQDKPVLQKMWEQCCRDSNLTGRLPILIFRRNGRTPCIMMETTYEHRLQEWFSPIKKFPICLDFWDKYTIMSLRDFLEWIPDIRPALNKRKSLIKLRK